MRFHLLSVPNVQTTRAYSLDGFCMATIKFARILKGLGHEVILYASEENEAPCDELVTIITKDEQQRCLGNVPYQYASSENVCSLWEISNNRLGIELGKRKQPIDFVCSISGTAQKQVADQHPELMWVEYSIGYVSSFSDYRVFESTAWQHWTYGKQQIMIGRFFDAVIPYFFDPNEFDHTKKKECFALYVGRLTHNKGLGVACRTARLAGIPLKVVGHGCADLVCEGAEYLGTLPDDERNDLLARASVLIAPTLYIEPFGSMVIEAQLSGTPVVATNFGAFTETVENGGTGFLCNYMDEFVRGVRDAMDLHPNYIRQRAVSKYSLAAVAPQYQAYFDRLMLLNCLNDDFGFETVRTKPEIAKSIAQEVT
jgi:glycosyltransferase involved in cell wall biosynthesis